MRPTKSRLQIRKGFEEAVTSQKEAIAMKCAECLGFFVDGWEKCTSKTCSLIKFFPAASFVNPDKFLEKMREKARELGNDNSFVTRIGRKQDSARQRSKKADGVGSGQMGG